MNRVAVAFGLIAAIVGYSAFAAFFIGHENRELMRGIDSISEAIESGSREKASEAAEKFCSDWHSFEKRMCVFIRDDKLNSVSASAAKIKPCIASANDELEAELQSIKTQLFIMYRSELPLWYNIL